MQQRAPLTGWLRIVLVVWAIALSGQTDTYIDYMYRITVTFGKQLKQ